MSLSQKFLVIGGILSFAVALFQAVISFSPSWSRYFGAPEEILANIFVLIITGLIAAVIFAVFGLYALSGAGYIRSLPWLWLGLWVISGVYILRGLFLIPQVLILAGVIESGELVSPQGLVSSLVSLITGILYLAGIVGRRQRRNDC